jgi:hypothetical protein
LSVYINKGDGTFKGPAVHRASQNLGLATADVDHDGNLDLIGEWRRQPGSGHCERGPKTQ